jgi:hypothetical protein
MYPGSLRGVDDGPGFPVHLKPSNVLGHTPGEEFDVPAANNQYACQAEPGATVPAKLRPAEPCPVRAARRLPAS